MKPKSIKITYWVLVILLCLFMLADAYGGITMQPAGVTELKHLGYPSYIMPMFGWLKVLGVIALLQTRWSRIKEWVFAGMVFIFIGAFVSHVCTHDAIVKTIMPLVFMTFTFVVRWFWLKFYGLKRADNSTYQN